MTTQFDSFSPDATDKPVVAFHVTIEEAKAEIPLHTHLSGQLIVALKGAVSCYVPDALWIVPPGCAVWIPGNTVHRCLATKNAEVCCLFVKPKEAELPSQPCTLGITPLIRELTLHLASTGTDSTRSPVQLAMLMQVLLGELEHMPVARLRVPAPDHTGLRQITEAITKRPSDRRTMQEWSSSLSMSEKTFARLVVRETGLTFGRWRRQLQLLIAIQWLAGGESVKSVSADLGYATPTAFIKVFRAELGTTPASYLETLWFGLKSSSTN